MVAALCALADTPSHLRGIAHIRGHETDRLAALATELGGLGADVTEHADGLSLRPATAARRASGTPTPTTGWRTPASSSVRAVDGRPGRERRDHRQDLPRLRRRLVDAAVSRPTGRYSDEDVEHYDRPRRRTRPRTKERPAYDDAVDGVVVTVDRGRFTLLRRRRRRCWPMKARPLGPQGRRGRRPGARRRRRVRRRGRAWPGSSRSASARTVLRRTADDDDPVERVLVANADQLVVVTALADPEPRPRLIDRVPGGGVRRRDAAAAVPDQGRPRRPGDAAVDVPVAGRAVGGDPQGRRPDRAAGAAGRPGQRARRPQRRRQVDAGQRPGA